MENPNESAASLAWLGGELGLRREPPSRTQAVWQRVRDQMRATDQVFASIQDWVSDFWLCKGSQIDVLGLVPAWNPPDELDEWPVLGVDLGSTGFSGMARPTNHAAFAGQLAGVKEVPPGGSDAAVIQFYALDDATQVLGDVPMFQAQHVRAWLATAFGNLLMSIALTPQSDHALLVAESRRRLLIPRRLQAAPKWGVPFEEGELGLLYNCRQTPQGYLDWSGMRVGQGEEWLKHWQWLSASLHAEQTLPAVRLAARLMRCVPLLEALLSALDSDDAGLEHLALAVLRRWLLSLKAMAWLEDALSRPWQMVRPQDLSCFAFNALKPEWPRRFVALSHRSADAKPALQTTRAWSSSLFAIDASYVPAWETNTGMIWGLFAATPVLARIRSAHYAGSEWCLREAELIQHLAQRCDFLTPRYVLDVPLEQLADLDRIVEAWRPTQTAQSAPPVREYPPLFSVFALSAAHEWELRMLRAAGALRVLSVVYGSAELANELYIALLSSDAPIPVPPPTNNPDGWDAYRKIFRDLHAEFGPACAPAPLLFPPGYAEADAEAALRLGDAIPDLSSGTPALEDVLAALEWQKILLPLAQDSNVGDIVLIDLRGLTRQDWVETPHLSMLRGILALRSPSRPIWLIQYADQGVDAWELPGDHPIFTQYMEDQFGWMWEASLGPGWPDAYAEGCGLSMCQELRERCRSTRNETD